MSWVEKHRKLISKGTSVGPKSKKNAPMIEVFDPEAEIVGEGAGGFRGTLGMMYVTLNKINFLLFCFAPLLIFINQFMKCLNVVPVCVPFLDWNPRCFKVWWWWVGCPTWNNCKWKVDNVICIAGCEIKKVANKFVAWAQQVGIKVLVILSSSSSSSLSSSASSASLLSPSSSSLSTSSSPLSSSSGFEYTLSSIQN